MNTGITICAYNNYAFLYFALHIAFSFGLHCAIVVCNMSNLDYISNKYVRMSQYVSFICEFIAICIRSVYSKKDFFVQ